MNTVIDRFLAVPLWQRVLLQIMLMIGIAALWYNFLYMGISKDIDRQQARTKEITQTIAQNQAAKKNAEEIQARITKISDHLDDIRQKLPENAELGNLLQQIHGQAKIVGLDIARFERADTIEEDLFIRIPVRMTLRGSFHHIATFFYYIGNLNRVVNVENISLRVLEHRSDGPWMEAICTATTFVYRSGGAQ